MKWMLRRAVLPALALTIVACICGSLPTAVVPTRTRVPSVAASPTSLAEVTEPPVGAVPGSINPQSATRSPTVAAAGDLGLQYQAMRTGMESDVDAYLSGSFYQVDLTLRTDPLEIEGVEQVHFYNASSDTLSAVVFRLYPNALTGERTLDISSARIEGVEVDAEFQVSDTALIVPLAEPLPPDGAVDIELTFFMMLRENIQIGWGRIANDNGVIVLSSFLPILSVYEPNGWWMEFPNGTGDPAYSDVSLWDVRLDTPENLVVASTGTIVEFGASADQSVSYDIVSGPVRDFSIALSDAFELDTAEQNGVTVNIWSLQGSSSTDTDQQAVDVAADAVRIYDEQFGTYPYREIDVVQAPIYAAGIEYPGLIYIADEYWSGGEGSFMDLIIAHEVAHQWWYGVVGNNQVDAPWIDEGLTEYSVIVYYTEAEGSGAGEAVRDAYQREVDSYLAQGNDREPVGLPAEQYNERQYRVFVYSAGALFYSYLEDQYGKDAVRAFLRDYFTRFRYDLVDNAELEQLVVEHFGPEADDFFTDWVYTGE